VSAQEPAHEPALIPGGLLLDWLDTVFADLTWPIPAGSLAPGLPATAVLPRQLRQLLLAEATGYDTRDAIWAGIVARSRQPEARGTGSPRSAWTSPGCAAGCASGSGSGTPQDLPDVHADLVCGFLTRLATIDTSGRNIAGRLIDSAIGHAARRYAARLDRPRPTDLATDANITRPLRPRPGNPEVALRRVAARLAHAGTPVSARDVELIARTRLESDTLLAAAADLGLTAEAAYKRRQRAEHRIAAHRLRIREPDPAGPQQP